LSSVALLAEGVGRNRPTAPCGTTSPMVALLAEGVGRNKFPLGCETALARSPSSRRAWVEIGRHGSGSGYPQSPSSRRAWVEITKRMMVFYTLSRRPPRGGRG